MSTDTDFVLELVAAVTRQNGERLDALGLTVDSELEARVDYPAEISVRFMRGTNLVTAFEDATLDDGKLIASREEFESWFRSTFVEVLDEIDRGDWD